MADILGEALQKLTPPEIPPLAEKTHIRMSDASPAVSAAQPANTFETCTDITPAKNVEPNHVVDIAATRRSPLQFIQEHRRQAAAIVIAACIAVFWFEDSSNLASLNSGESESAQVDADVEELMLDEFDAIEVTPKREPAEPAEVTSADPFSMTIPRMESDSAHASSQTAEHPLLQQSIGDVRNHSAVQAESGGSLEFPAQQSPDNSPPAIPRAVRFTGRIQPLN